MRSTTVRSMRPAVRSILVRQPKEVEAIPESDDPPIEPVPPASESKAELVDAAPAADTMSEAGAVDQNDSDAEDDEPAQRFLIPTSYPINEMDCLGNPQREMLYDGWESGYADEECSVISRSFRKGFLKFASSPFNRLSERQLFAIFNFARDGLAFLMCEAACRRFCRMLRGSTGLGPKLWVARPMRYGERVLATIPGICVGTTTYENALPACTYPHDLSDGCGRQGVLEFAALSVMRDEMCRSGNAGLVIFRHIVAERWATIVADVYARSRCLGVNAKLVRLDLTDIIKDVTEIVETWAIELIRNAVRCSIHRKSSTLTAADLELARTITQDRRTMPTEPYLKACDSGVDVNRVRLSGQLDKRFSIDALPSIRVAVKDRIIRSLVRRAGGVAFNVRAYEMLWVLILQRMCRLLERVAVLAAYREGVDSDPTLSLRPEIRDLMYANEGLEGRFYSSAEHMDTDDDDDDDDDDDSSIGSLSDLSTDDGEYDPDERDIAAEAQARLERSLARRKCDACGKQGEISERPFPTCDLCGHRRYCGRRCQRADWLTHKVDCPGYAQQQMMET